MTRTQPEKMAAFEALWETRDGAPFTVFGLPDEKNERTLVAVRIPKMLSLLVHFDPNGRVLGLSEFPKDERPPVLLPFAGYHVMILLGLVFILIAAAGFWLQVKKKVVSNRAYLKLLLFAVPLPFLANETGCIAAEVGRHPWAVYKVLRTSEAVSTVVPAGNILFSIILFAAIYDHSVHIAHISLKEEVLLIKAAKERGIKVTCEVCPHHLSLSKDAGQCSASQHCNGCM